MSGELVIEFKAKVKKKQYILKTIWHCATVDIFKAAFSNPSPSLGSDSKNIAWKYLDQDTK